MADPGCPVLSPPRPQENQRLWRADNADRAPCADWLAGYFGRRRGALLSSGTMALELALIHLGVRPGWRVVLSSGNCPQVAAAVLRCGAVPVIVDTGETLVMTADALRGLGERPDAVIAVHEWGLPCPLAELRAVLGPDVRIIEDAASAWAMHGDGSAGARIADAVVTSLGPGKPLSIGGGGAAFADDDIGAHLDTASGGIRTRLEPALAASLSRYALPHIAHAVRRATARTEDLRQRVPALLRHLEALGLCIWRTEGTPPPSWGFVPVRVRSDREFAQLRHAPEAGWLGVSAPATLAGLPMLAGRATFVRTPTPGPRWILLDPVAALADPDIVERWARKATP